MFRPINAKDEANEVTLKDRVGELEDKFDYVAQSIYLLEGSAEKSNELISMLNEHLSECMNVAAESVSEVYANDSITSATNTAGIAAKPSCKIFGDDECTESFVDMIKNDSVKILVTEPDDEFNEFAINESEIPESLQNAAVLIDENDGDVENADVILFWTVPTEFTADDVNALQAEVERYFAEYQKLMGCENDTLNLALWVSKDTSDNEEATEVRILNI